MIPLVDLRAEYEEVGSACLDAVAHVAERSSFILGEEVEAFEEEFASFIGVKNCIATSSGTDALRLIVEALGLHDVILPTNTFASVASVIPNPSFIDCQADGSIDSHEVDLIIYEKNPARIHVLRSSRVTVSWILASSSSKPQGLVK